MFFKTYRSRRRMVENLNKSMRDIRDVLMRFDEVRDKYISSDRAGSKENAQYYKGAHDILKWILRMDKPNATTTVDRGKSS